MLEGDGSPAQALDAHRSRSTSTLLSGEETAPRRRSGNGLFPCHSGLSVSHDSVFTAEHRTPHSSSEDLDTAQSSSSLSIQQLVLPGVRAELLDALRRRRGRGDCTSEDDEDLGLPHSPCNSPTTADVLLEQGLKENPTKSRSTCSDGSLLSMGSSEMDEDSLGQHSGHSSKQSLHDKKTFHDSDLEFDLGVSAIPLSHSAARHKMAVRPKRTHGAPRRRRIQQLAGGSPLPSTPELNEEASGRSASPDVRTSFQDFTGTDELSTTIAASNTDQDTAWPSAHSVVNPLPAETQLKSASLPPGLALTPEVPNAERPITSIVSKVKRSNSNIAHRPGTNVQQFQRSVSEHENGYSARVSSMAECQYHTKFMAETDVMSKTLVKSGVNSEMQKRICGVVGEEEAEEEETREDDINDDMLNKERERDGKKKDDSSFFSRFIRRSGKKKKDSPQDVDSISNSSVYSSKQVSEVPPVVPKRIDMKGRYANETVNDYAVNIPPSQMKLPTGKVGGTRSTPASRQRVMPINIPASPEGQRKVETNRELEEMTVGLPLSSSLSPVGTELETTSKNAQESISVNRVQVSYSSSPPKPTWPEPSKAFYSSKPPNSPFNAVNKINSCSEIPPPWRDSLEPRLADKTWVHDQEHSVTELRHFRSKLKIAGLSSYQQRLIANEFGYDEREYTSMIDTVSSEDSEESKKHAVKKSKSFRMEPDVSVLSHNLPASSTETETDSLNKSPVDCYVKGEILWKYEVEQTKAINSHKRIDNRINNDASLQSLNASSTAEDLSVFNGSKEEADKTDLSSEYTGRHFTKYTLITTRGIANETSGITESSPVAGIRRSRQLDHIMKKSASLDSIGSLNESKKSHSPEPQLYNKKSTSSESICSLTQHVLIPVSSDGLGIIEDSKTAEERRPLPNTESSTVPASQLIDSYRVSPSDVPKPIMFSVSSKPSLPESSKAVVDTSSKSSEPSSRLSAGIPNHSVEKAFNKMPIEREQSQILAPHRAQVSRSRAVAPSSSTEQVPEFLKVQLNRVDSKPVSNVVLSTSVVFDNVERSYSPLKFADERQTRLKRKESLVKLTENTNTEGAEAALNEVLITDTPAIQTQISCYSDKKSSREDLITGGSAVYDSNMATQSPAQKVVESCSSGAAVQETCQKTVIADSDSSSRVLDNDSTSPKQRSRSLSSTNSMNMTGQKYSVVSVSSSVSSSSPVATSKPVLKKQATSLDSAEKHRGFMKKQKSEDFEDVFVFEKSVAPNVKEVSSSTSHLETVSSQKKPVTKEYGSRKEEESVATERILESGSVEVVLRNKKIISIQDFGLKKEEDTNLVERCVSGVDAVNNQEGKKFGLWRDEERQAEKQTSGGDIVGSHENNLGTSEVVLRKKSLPRSDTGRGAGGKDEEPELLKVFARRSLKLKDSEIEALGQQVATKTRTEYATEQQGTKSRDSDKENEGGDSPREERKKQVIKEPLAESKIHIESSETAPLLKASSAGISLSNTSWNGNIVTGTNKYQRSLSSGVTMSNEHTTQNNDSGLTYRKENPGTSPDKRQRNRTVPEIPKTELNLEKMPRAWAKDIDITNSETKRSNMDKINSQVESKTVSGNSDESGMPRFKRIQQRKEEWELRAQQALKKTLP
ncbi:uncharacterized protein LOC110829533 isoform X3 [Zootermopsis nevadensis]|nr:uncharacterized protein LOC110829533 isoform X3 [Zootermopsis nevadensis]